MKQGSKALSLLKASSGIAASLLLVMAGGSAAAQPSDQATPTCSDTLGISVHGQHIIGDYVSGLHGDLEWPPSKQVGEAVSANRGVVVRGGPGPGFHFPNEFAPGASFCTESRSPGTHL